MMKSQRYATKLRLSKLTRFLLIIGCLKLCVLGASFFDLPMPMFSKSSSGHDENTKKTVEYTAAASNETLKSSDEPDINGTVYQSNKNADQQPQGSKAAELAAAVKPRRYVGQDIPSLPAPLISATPGATVGVDSSFTPLLPQPPALGAPLAKAGVILPSNNQIEQSQPKDGIWNMLAVTSLPIPLLGSVQAAHAAAIDMPVPSVSSPYSPMTPVDQVTPLVNGGSVLPGTQPLPANIPRGQMADGKPLPPRQGPPPRPNNGYMPPNGTEYPVIDAPAPNIQPNPLSTSLDMGTPEMARQQQDMLILRQQMDQRLKDLQDAEDKMKDVLREAKNTEDKKVKSLILMYANMKPRMAAQALENMDERVAIRILSGMAPKQSGEILTYTNPAKTAKFTELLTKLH